MHTESDQWCGMDSVQVGNKTMARTVKQKLVTSNLATHHRISVTHCLTSSLLDLCAGQNVYPSMYSSLSSCLIFLSGEPLFDCAFYMYCVLCSSECWLKIRPSKNRKGESSKWAELEVYPVPSMETTSDCLLISILMCIYWKCPQHEICLHQKPHLSSL